MVEIKIGRAAWPRLLLAVIVAVYTVGLLPNTLSAAPSPPHKVVIFVSGLGSSLTATTASGLCSSAPESSFGAIGAALAGDGFTCADSLLYSYTGGTVDSSGVWHPTPYGCYDTGNHVATSVGKLVALMTTYRTVHPNAQFVLIGHSLGGLIALDASAKMPVGAILRVVTIDSPLQKVSRHNLKQFTQLVAPFIAYAGCSKVLWDSDAARDIATIHNHQTRLKAKGAAAAIVRKGHKRGVRYMTVGNASDCLWKPSACKIGGTWRDDSKTMTIASANKSKLYPLGTAGCDLSNVINKDGVVQFGNVPEIICIGASHGLALQSPNVIADVVTFVGPGSS